MTVLSLAEQIAVRGRHDRRGRLQESVVELVAEKSDIAHLQDWKGFVRNGHERAAWQRRLAHAATRRRKGEFIQVRRARRANRNGLVYFTFGRENEF